MNHKVNVIKTVKMVSKLSDKLIYRDTTIGNEYPVTGLLPFIYLLIDDKNNVRAYPSFNFKEIEQDK